MRGRVRETLSELALAVCLLSGLIPACGQDVGQADKEPNMSAQMLEQRIVAKDETAPALAAQLGAAAEPVLVRLARHSDPEVRELNVAAIRETAVPQRVRLLIEALADRDINVRSAALRALSARADGASVPALLEPAQRNADPFVRGEVALIIGRLGDMSAVAPLSGTLSVERDGDVKRKLVLALARLGDTGARGTVKSALASSDPQARLDAVMDYEYVGDPKLLVDLRPALADTAEVLNVNPPHARPNLIRLCDVAVNVIANVAQLKLPFNGVERRRFEPSEIAEVARRVSAL